MPAAVISSVRGLLYLTHIFTMTNNADDNSTQGYGEGSERERKESQQDMDQEIKEEGELPDADDTPNEDAAEDAD